MSRERADRSPGDAVLTPEEIQSIARTVDRLPNGTAASIDALRLVQRRLGWISDQALTEVADVLGLSTEELDGIATFYNLIYRRPVGRHVILLCDSVSCWLLGCDRIQAALRREVGIGLGETTDDGRFTLLPMACLGACDHAPVLMIDDRTHRDVSEESVPRILEDYP